MREADPNLELLALLDPGGGFRSRLVDDLVALRALSRALTSAATPAVRDILAEAERLAHRLAGAAGTFGFHNVSAAAIRLEDAAFAALGAARIDRTASLVEASRLEAAMISALTHIAEAGKWATSPSVPG